MLLSGTLLAELNDFRAVEALEIDYLVDGSVDLQHAVRIASQWKEKEKRMPHHPKW